MNAANIKAQIREWERACPEGVMYSPSARGAMCGAIDAPLLPAEGKHKHKIASARRRMVLAWLFGGPLGSPATAISSTQLNDRQWYALYQWIGFWEDRLDGWQHRPEFDVECACVYAQAVADERAKMAAFMETA